MILKFFAKKDHVVHWPGVKRTGQIHNYVGRQFIAADPAVAAKTRVTGENRALKEPAGVESDSPEGRDLAHAARSGGLWAADEATAREVGIDFVKLAFSDTENEWMPAQSARSSSRQPTAATTE